MRLLAAIPHYADPGRITAADGRRHGSTADPIARRAEALASCIAALHQLYGETQHVIEIKTKIARPTNAPLAGTVDVVVCTTKGRHLLDGLPLPQELYSHRLTDAEPMLLGFECHAALRDGLGHYDYYAYLEDDLIARDPWMFVKLAWFNANLGDSTLLQPNRYEVARRGVVMKAYLDGEFEVAVTRPFQDIREFNYVKSELLNASVGFQRPTNPHSGCFFLNAAQMDAWCRRPDFLDRDTSFIGPLESAATLGIMRAFRVYKPSPENAAFLEIEHHGTGFIANLRRRGAETGAGPGEVGVVEAGP